MNNFCMKCGAQLQPGMNLCPYCGTPLNNNYNNNFNQRYYQNNNMNYQKKGTSWVVKTIVIIGIVFLCLIACGRACSNLNKEIYDDKSGQTSFKVGDTFQNKHIKLTFDSSNLNFTKYHKYATIKSGYKIVEFIFTAYNIGETNQTIDYTDFDCYADGIGMQQFYSTDGSGFDSGGTISPGKKVIVQVYCEVPKESEKVTVEYKPILADKNYEFIAS